MSSTIKRIFCVAAAVAIVAAAAVGSGQRGMPAWTDEELRLMESLSIERLPPLLRDPTNRVADEPAAASLGHRLFFDPRLSSNGKVSCASCHQPERDFQDGVPFGVGVGVTPRRTMPIAGTAHSAWLFWDGRKDSQWSQALGPLESSIEHGGSRVQFAHIIADHYREAYEALFGPLPDLSRLPETGGPVEDSTARANWDALSDQDRDAVNRIFSNLGKTIAAYERTIQFGPSRFDRFVESVVRKDVGVRILTVDEQRGLRLFLGKAQCINCHNGPLFTDHDFHNTGVPAVPNLPRDMGRALGARQVLNDEFNCGGAYSDAPDDCDELAYMLLDDKRLVRAYKPPTLRGVATRAPYMHAGQFEELRSVLEHYNAAPSAPDGHSELKPLGLSDLEVDQLEAFLRSLDGPLIAPSEFLRAPAEFVEAL